MEPTSDRRFDPHLATQLQQRPCVVRIANCARSATATRVLLRATDEQSLLKEICRIVCEEAGYRVAWVGYAEHDEAKSVRPVAWTGAEEGYLANLGITWADTERGRGPSGTAIRSGKTSCIEDYATDPRLRALAGERFAARFSFRHRPAAQGRTRQRLRQSYHLFRPAQRFHVGRDSAAGGTGWRPGVRHRHPAFPGRARTGGAGSRPAEFRLGQRTRSRLSDG